MPVAPNRMTLMVRRKCIDYLGINVCATMATAGCSMPLLFSYGTLQEEHVQLSTSRVFCAGVSSADPIRSLSARLNN